MSGIPRIKYLADMQNGLWKLLEIARVEALLDFHIEILKTTITYVPLAKALHTFSGGNDLAGWLGDIQTSDYESKKPFRSSIVIGAPTGIPGLGYFAHAKELGCEFEDTDLGRFLFWSGQMKQLGVPLNDVSNARGAALTKNLKLAV